MPVPFLRAEVARLIVEGPAASVLAAGLSLGIVAARAQRQPEAFFKAKVGLSDSEIQKIEHGHVLTKMLESGDKKYGILVFRSAAPTADRPAKREPASLSSDACHRARCPAAPISALSCPSLFTKSENGTYNPCGQHRKIIPVTTNRGSREWASLSCPMNWQGLRLLGSPLRNRWLLHRHTR
jgi:hypothetical protein